MVVYYRLFDLLKRKDMKVSDLRGVISSATVAKLNKHQHISGECIDKICRYLQCQPSDMMEIVESDEEKKRREQGENAMESMSEHLYEFIVASAKSTKQEPKELWKKYLELQTEKKKADVDFKKMVEYVEKRLSELE